jgi:hypothetical protein
MSITSSWRLNTIQSRAPGCVWNSGQNPVYTAGDPSDAVLTLLIHAPGVSDVILSSDRIVFNLI